MIVCIGIQIYKLYSSFQLNILLTINTVELLTQKYKGMGKFGLILLASISLSITLQTSSNAGEENANSETAVTVSRRILFDLFTLHGNNTDVLHKSCIVGSNQTYLVVENKCIDNEDLLNGNCSRERNECTAISVTHKNVLCMYSVTHWESN